MTAIKDFFKEKMEAELSTIGINNPQEEQFIIVPTSEEEKLTSMDERYKRWDTPGISKITMCYESVLNSLVKERKKVIPLWIKMYKEEGKAIVLEVSHRYRKMRDVILRYRDYENAPFKIVEESTFVFNSSKERREAIRILFFTQQLSVDVKRIIGDEIKFHEVKLFFKNHFENYKFYPQAYTHIKEGTAAYSSIVMEADLKTNTFSIFKNPNINAKLKSKIGIEKAVKYYLEEELKNEICGISIKF